VIAVSRSWKLRALLALILDTIRHPVIAWRFWRMQAARRRWQREMLQLADGKDATYWATASMQFRRKGDSYRQSLGRSHPRTQECYEAAARCAAIMTALKSAPPTRN
jgi:hypothetical protein